MQANHFPGTWQLGRKDKLYTNIARAKRNTGSFYNVIPKFYILPRDRQELKQHAAAHPDQLYIQKVSHCLLCVPTVLVKVVLLESPNESKRGRGVKGFMCCSGVECGSCAITMSCDACWPCCQECIGVYKCDDIKIRDLPVKYYS